LELISRQSTQFPANKAGTRAGAMDSASYRNFVRRFPDAARIKVLG
jgi:hypothetical protein